jgi:serine/threonine-protein kinase
VLKNEYMQTPACIEMLRREAYLGKKASHPHLGTVLGAQTQAAPYFLALPYLEGATLAQALSIGQPLAASCSLWVGRQTAEALAALHGFGWQHGDLKPANLLIAPTGHVTLFDLGLARPLDSAKRGEDNVFAGTVAYAAPETFCSAHAPSAASDIYSLGVVMFESLTGQLPFHFEDADQTAAAHVSETPPDIRALAPHVPGRVARVISRMLSKDPLRRPDALECVDLFTTLEIETFGEGVLRDCA